MEANAIHSHCMNCINLNCAFKARDPSFSCKMISCKLECGRRFHMCKQPEHELLCDNEKVPCINAEFGCPFFLLRSKLAEHLETCPCSVVFCNKEWSRRMSAASRKLNPELQTNLDVASAFMDQRNIDLQLKIHLQKKKIKSHPAIPAKSGLVASGKKNDGDETILHTKLPKGESRHFADDSPCGTSLVAQNSPQSFSTQHNEGQIARIEVDQDSDDANDDTSDEELYLDLDVENIRKFRFDGMFSVSCSNVFRRDEFPMHYKNVHSDIHGGLNGWFEHRCPLAAYGCTYSMTRLYPTSKETRIIHCKWRNSFGVKPFVVCNDATDSEACNNVHMKSQEKSVLLELPEEVLFHIFSYLDPLSLGAADDVCLAFHNTCNRMLKKKGIISESWSKKNGCWRGVKVWIFSTAFSPVLKWGFMDNPHMSNHMRECPYFERNRHLKPYNLSNEEPRPEVRAAIAEFERQILEAEKK